MEYQKQVLQERPLSEGDQVKIAIRELFCESRKGSVYTQYNPLKKTINNVNGNSTETLCLFKHDKIPGAVVMWYEVKE